MRKLSISEINYLAGRKGVKKTAVMNFLSTLGYAGSKSNELANLSMDASLFHWNYKTVEAIRLGIELAYKDEELVTI